MIAKACIFMKSTVKSCFNYVVFLISLSFSFSQGAVGIGTNNPHPSAVLEVKSTNKGMLIPRVNRAPMTTVVSNPVKGLIVFNENANFNAFEYYDGSDWIQLIPTPSKFDLDMSSNKITDLKNGTDAGDAVNLGQLNTVDNNNLDRNGTEAMTGNLNMNNRKVTNVSNGTSSRDAVNRSQLDTKANKQQTAWRNLTLINGYRVSNNRTPQYRVDEFGVVHLRGDIYVDPSVTSLLVTAAMDTDARPSYSKDLITSASTSRGLANLRIRSVGDISFSTRDLPEPDPYIVHLSGISYYPR